MPPATSSGGIGVALRSDQQVNALNFRRGAKQALDNHLAQKARAAREEDRLAAQVLANRH